MPDVPYPGILEEEPLSTTGTQPPVDPVVRPMFEHEPAYVGVDPAVPTPPQMFFSSTTTVTVAEVPAVPEIPKVPLVGPLPAFRALRGKLYLRAFNVVSKAMREVSHLERELAYQHKILENYGGRPSEPKQPDEDDWKRMLADGVTDVDVLEVDGETCIEFVTPEIYILTSTYCMGRYKVRMNLDYGSVIVLPSSDNTYGNNSIHPHVGSGGMACLGHVADDGSGRTGERLQDLILSRLCDLDVPGAVAIVLCWLRSYNEDDAYVKLRRWDSDWPQDGICEICGYDEDDCECRLCEGCEETFFSGDINSCDQCGECCSDSGHAHCDSCGDHCTAVCGDGYCQGCCDHKHSHCNSCGSTESLCRDNLCGECCADTHCDHCGESGAEFSADMRSYCPKHMPEEEEEEVEDGGIAGDPGEPTGVGQDEGPREGP